MKITANSILPTILVTLISIGTLFLSSAYFVDGQLMPKWLALGGGIVILSIYYSIKYLATSNQQIISHIFITKIASGIIVASTFLQALYGIFQYVNFLPSNNFFQVTGSFDNPAGFAASLCVAFPFYIWWGTKSQGILRWILIFITFLTIGAVICSESRTGILSLLIVLFCWGIQKIETSRSKKIISLSLICITVIAGLYFIKKDSANGRILIWKCAIPMLKHNWLTGYGTGGFEAHYMDYQAAYFEQHPNDSYSILADNVQYPFCEYLRIIIDYGVIGILSLFGWLSFLLFCYFKYPSELSKTALLCWVVMCTFSCFSYPSMYPFVWLVLIYTIYILTRVHIKNILKYCPHLWRKVFATLCIVLSIYAGCRIFTRMEAEIQWARIAKQSLMSKALEVLPEYEELKKTLGNDRYFLYNYSTVLFQTGHYHKSLTIAMECKMHWADYDVEMLLGNLYEYLQQIQKAEQCYLQASYMCPSRFAPLYQLVLLLKKEERLADADQIANEIINKPEKIHSPTISLIKKEMENLTNREN